MIVPEGAAIFSADGKYLGLFQSTRGLNQAYLDLAKSYRDEETNITIVFLHSSTGVNGPSHWAQEIIAKMCVIGEDPRPKGQQVLW